MSGWLAVHTEYGEVHVLPVDDLRPHLESDGCWCRPFYDEWVCVHNSADRREDYEKGRKPS